LWSGLGRNRRGPLGVIPGELQLVDLLVRCTRAAILGSKTAVILHSRQFGGSVPVGGFVCCGLSGMEVEPDGSQRWETCANYGKRQLNIRPEEHRGGVVDDVVWVLDVLLRNGIGGDDSSDAHGAYTGSLVVVTVPGWSIDLRRAQCKHEDNG
jgi:hypothetical protein